MSSLEKYCREILSGKINACEKIKKVCRILLHDIKHPGKYRFDPCRAKDPVEFIENFCNVPTGKIGQPLKLELFQKARLEAIFGFIDENGNRKFREVLVIEGRKNGKTTELAAIELYMLLADGEGAPQIYNLATAAEQAGLGFAACRRMIAQSPTLASRIKKRKSDLYYEKNLGTIKVLSSETKHLDGLDVQCAVIDELAAITNRDIYDLAIQGTTAREQPLIVTISTNGFVREGIFDAQYDYAARWLDGKIENEHFLPFIYELDDPENEWTKESAWIKANPGLGTIKKIETLRGFVNKALDDESFRPTVLVKDFNAPQTAVTSWLSWDEIVNHETWKTDEFDYSIGGFDAADSVDLNSAKALCMRPGDDRIYIKSMYWIPERVIEIQQKRGSREERDKVPYEKWIAQGLMRSVPGNKVDKRVFLDWFLELRDEQDLYTLYIGYDPWHIDDSLLREFKANFGEKSMIPVRQGARTMSTPMKNIKADFAAHKIVYDDNPIDRWCLYNTQIKTDVNYNIQPVKAADQTQRIDGTISLLCAYIVAEKMKGEFVQMNEPAQ